MPNVFFHSSLHPWNGHLLINLCFTNDGFSFVCHNNVALLYCVLMLFICLLFFFFIFFQHLIPHIISSFSFTPHPPLILGLKVLGNASLTSTQSSWNSHRTPARLPRPAAHVWPQTWSRLAFRWTDGLVLITLLGLTLFQKSHSSAHCPHGSLVETRVVCYKHCLNTISTQAKHQRRNWFICKPNLSHSLLHQVFERVRAWDCVRKRECVSVCPCHHL